MLQMNRKYQISKQTEDKVKLAKHYIERIIYHKTEKYRALLEKEQQLKIGWQRVMKALDQIPISKNEKKVVVEKVLNRESSQIRRMRVKDKLTNYELLSMIGKGAFGDVRLAKLRETEEVVAIKRMTKQKLVGKKQIASVFLERQCLSKNKSQWLVQLRSAFQDQFYLYIAMEWVPGGDLLRLLIERDIFTEYETRFYVSELILAVQDMHRMHYIHRDIKPDNILIDSLGHLKLTDFGLSKHLEPRLKMKNTYSKQNVRNQRNSYKRLKAPRKRHFSKVGTPDYIAPEVLTDQSYDHRVDIWSIGVIMFQCLFGYPPFSHEDAKEVCQRVIDWDQYLNFPDTPKVSLQAKLLILGMLSPKEHRLTISQIKSHAFFDGYNWNTVRDMIPPFKPKIAHQFDTANFDSFEDNQNWQWHEREERKSYQNRSSSLGYQYNFAGFDWQPQPQKTPFAQTLKQIQNLGKRKSSSPFMKRVNTQQSQNPATRNSRQFKMIRHSVKVYQKSQNRGLKKIGLKFKS